MNLLSVLHLQCASACLNFNNDNNNTMNIGPFPGLAYHVFAFIINSC